MQRLRNLLLVSTALMPLGLSHVLAGPNGATVVGGNATVQNQGTANVTVNQFSDKAIINWNLFNIGVGEKTTFVQPNSNSVALNRITGGQGPSEILGSLDANGKVFLINRDGFIFGAGAVVTTAGFLATTSDIKNQDFMAGRYNFQTPGRPDASIVNMGTITATSGGFAALVAPGVRNSGTITATLGTVALAAGNTFNLDFYGDKLVTIGVGDEIAGKVKDVATGETLKSLVTNEGKLKANGGRVELTAAAARHVVDSVINTSGVIEANSVGMKNGQIVLGAATASTKNAVAQSAGGAKVSLPKQTVRVSGSLSASGKDKGTKGGSVIVTGEHIEVAGATIDASGVDGGGKVLLGGDWAGGKPDRSLVNNQSAQLESFSVPTATTLSVDAASRIDASAKERGDGGKVILWSDQTTTFAGTILALGGREFGNGGFVETSGKVQLNYSGNVDTRAPNGAAGTLLLDPADFTVGTVDGPNTIANTTLQTQLASSNVTIATDNSVVPGNGDIFVQAPVVWNASTTLTMSAFRNVNIAFVGGSTGAIQNTGGGNLVIRADSSGTGTGTINLASGTDSGRINWGGSTGTVTFYYNPTTFGTQNNFTTGNGRVVTNGLTPVPNQFTAYMLVNDSADLTLIGTNASTLGEKYALGRDIDATNFPSTTPLGNFTGVLDGFGGIGPNRTISNLTLAPTSGGISNIGLFSTTAIGSEIRNLNFSNAQISANPNVAIGPGPTGVQYVGVVAGQMAGTLKNVHVTSSSVNASAGPWVVSGGLVGMVSGQILSSTSAASVLVGNGAGPTTRNYAGGLAGRTDVGGDISGSSASGNITAGNNSYAGGLVGQVHFNSNASNIGNSSATGAVNVGANSFAGGLVGMMEAGNSILTGSSASGNVTSTGTGSQIGGLVGRNEGGIAVANVLNSTVTAFNSNTVGGAVGHNTGSIGGLTATNVTVTGTASFAGGLVGINSGSINSSSVSGSVNRTATSLSAQFGGLVGQNASGGTITDSSSSATLSGNAGTMGGLVGFNDGGITNSNASGSVTAGVSAYAGGLVAHNRGTITGSGATGNVTGGNGSIIGGLVGFNDAAFTSATITGSSASGVVATTGANVTLGGLVGQNSGTITNSTTATHAINIGNFNSITAGGLVGKNTGAISNSTSAKDITVGDSTTGTQQNNVGGLVGTNNGGTITSSGASGAVSGGANTFAGGLIGRNDNGTIQTSSATGNVTITAANAFGTATGGLVGFNGSTSTITGSSASGSVSTNAGGMAGGLVGQNEGNIASSSYAGGTVSGTGTSGNKVILGGLVGTNNTGGQITGSSTSGTVNLGAFGDAGSLVGGNNANITNSTSSATVNATGNGVSIGGLVGSNFATGTITASRATGNVTASFNATTPFDMIVAGGLVGTNFGTINGNASPPTAATACASGQTCATGAVSVGTHGSGGGLAGMNQGTITNAFATGAVTGAVGLGEDTGTVLGGLVGLNNSTGTITGSHARGGNVGSNVAFLLAGGLVGDNLGSIANSFSSRNVIAGNQSQVGGLAGASGGDCPGCLGTITNATASGNVTAGTGSIAGGLVGGMGENTTFNGLSASGNVTAGADSVIGGLVGALGPGSTLSNSQSSGTVTGTGSTVMAGGLVGLSFGAISNSTTSSLVSVAGDSFAGGLVGGNLGRVENSSPTAATVTGGSNSVVGGLTGLNAGTISQSNTAISVTTGDSGVAGGLVGANIAFEGVPAGLTLPGSSFPSGTIVSSTSTGAVSGGIGSTVGGLIGVNGGAITGLTASNSVSGGDGSIVGGLVGVNSGPSGGPDLPSAITGCSGCGLSGVFISSDPGSIANSTASGNLTGGFASTVGGLVGSNPGTITNSSTSNSIVGNAFSILGGLVGQNELGGSITGSSATGAMSGGLFIGGLAGMNLGSIANSNASSNVTGVLGSTSGGLAGTNFGSIANSNASGNVTGGEGSTLGGLVGINAGTVTNSFGTGAVIADPSIAGGLAGINIGTITGSWASGAVTGDAGSFVGGLVGFNLLGTIQNSYSVSNVTVGDGGTAGGLVAANVGAISQSFATGAVSGGIGSYVGGLVAYNFGDAGIPGGPLGTISQSYATGAVTGGASSVVGGLVAENAGSIDQAYATGRVTGGPGSITGGLVASNNFTVPSASSFPGNSSPPPSAPPPGFTSTPGTATNSYWDTQTTGQSQSAGGTPQTTAQMTSGIPSGFSPAAWSSGNGHYPFLTGQPDPLPLPGPPAPVDPNPPHHPPEPPTTPDHPLVKQPEPVVNLVLQQTNDTFTEKKQEEVVNTSTPSGPSGGSSPGGQKGGNPAGNNARPPIGAIAGYGLGPLPSGMPPLNETRFIADEVVFQLGARLSDRELASILDQLGLRVLYRQELGLLGRQVLRLKLPSGATVRGVIAAFEAKGANFSGQPVYQFELTQDVAQAPSPADTNRKGDSAQYIVEKLGLVEAHLLATGKGVKVAVIDSEIDSKHPDLEGAITGTFDALPSDDQTAHPHGTGMAGAIASHKRLLGVAPGAQLLAVRAFGVNTGGAQGTSLNIVKGLQWAVDQGAKIINMSFAGPKDPILQQAMKRLTDQGIILIGAAGNAGPKSPPLFPGADPNVIAVSATDVDDKTYKNANRGKYVAIAAPGVDILVPAPEGGYQLTTGTSVAAAHISGVVALMLERNKELRPSEVRSILSATAKKIGGAPTDVGAGLVDPVQALSKAGPKQAQVR